MSTREGLRPERFVAVPEKCPTRCAGLPAPDDSCEIGWIDPATCSCTHHVAPAIGEAWNIGGPITFADGRTVQIDPSRRYRICAGHRAWMVELQRYEPDMAKWEFEAK